MNWTLIVYEILFRVFYVASRRMLNVHLQLDTVYRWTKDYREERALREKMESYAMKVVNGIMQGWLHVFYKVSIFGEITKMW